MSPLGPLVAYARVEGYSARDASGNNIKPTAFHGYYVRILKAQGPNVPGGRFRYVINRRMIAGFSTLA